MEFYIFVYKACAVSLYTILVREVDGRFVTLFFNMSQNDLKRPNRILLIFSAIHIKSLAFRFATPTSDGQSVGLTMYVKVTSCLLSICASPGYYNALLYVTVLFLLQPYL